MFRCPGGYYSVHSAPARARALDARDRKSQTALVFPSPNMQGRGPYRRLARQAREAALRATPKELVDLEDLVFRVRRDELCVFEAQRTLTDVIRGQHEREAA
jgi:hypothetical protein